MANTNTTTSVVDTIFARCLLALRQYAVMPRYVNRAFDPVPGEKFSTINVPVPSAIAAQAVTPSYVPPDDAGVAPTNVQLVLDKWYETAFFLNDKEVQEIVAGVFEGQLSEAIKGLANQVDNDIFSTYKSATAGVYGFGGTPGTAPFAVNLDAFTDARKALTQQLASKDNRYFVMDPDAEANALGIRAVQDASWRPGAAQVALNEGEIGRVLGATWAVDQNVPLHTAGTWSAGTATGTAGTNAVTINSGTGSILQGDILYFGADPQSYVCLVPTGTAPTTAITVAPNLKTSPSTAAITFKASHRVNLLFSRDAFALAARPMEASDPFGINPNKRSIMDPVSGLSLTMEITRQHYRTRLALSSLYGVKLVRPEFAARVAG